MIQLLYAYQCYRETDEIIKPIVREIKFSWSDNKIYSADIKKKLVKTKNEKLNCGFAIDHKSM